MKEHNYHEIDATIIADSITQKGDRLTTFIITFPHIVLAEFNTHRMLSKNSASSRAIPFKKMLNNVKLNPFIPINWIKEHKGMQETSFIEDDDILQQCIFDWLQARDFAIQQAESLFNLEVTKQLCNRLLEPFMYHTAILSATEFSNFWSLKCSIYEIDDEHLESLK